MTSFSLIQCSVTPRKSDATVSTTEHSRLHSLVYQHLLNGIELYGNTKASYIDKLIKLNNKLLRILQSKPLSTPTRELYKTYNTLQLLDLHKQQLLLFVHK